MRSFGRRRSFIRGQADASLPFRILTVVPSTVPAGAGATAFDVNGIDFPPSAVVYLDGVLQPTSNRVSAFLIQFTASAAVIAVPGFKAIQVIDALGQNSNVFQIAVTFPLPTLASLTPAFAFLGSGATATLGTGTGIYTPGTGALVDGAAASASYGSPTTLNIVIASAVVDDAGDHTVEIVNPAPGGGTSTPARIFQSRYRAPAITSKSQSAFPIDSPDTTVVLTDAAGGYYNPGAWPDGGSEGLVDDSPVTTVFLSATQLRITVPAGALAIPGVHTIKVRNPSIGGGGGTSAASNFTVSQPSISAISFATRVRGFDPFTLRVTGLNLFPTDVVHYRNTPCATTYVNATTQDAVISAAMLAVAGPGDITIVSNTGFETNAIPFTVLPWDYTQIGATLRGFYPASTLVDDGTGRASQWTEFATGVRNLIQPNAAVRPDIVATVPTLNGAAAAYFNGSRGDFMEMEQWVVSTTTGLITKTEFNIWFAASAQVTEQVGANPTLLGDPGGYLGYGRVTAPGNVSALDDTSGSVVATAPFNWLSGQAINARVRKTGGRLYIRVNKGTEVSVVHGTPPSAFVPTDVLIGKGLAGGGFFAGFVGAWIACDSNINHTHRAQVDNLMAVEFGTSVGTTSGTLVPTVVAPATAVQFATPFEITVTVAGGAVAGDVVNVDGFVLPTIVDSATSLRGMLTAGSLFTDGLKGITIGNAAGIGPPLLFTVTPFIPGVGPNLTSVTPNTCTRCDDPFPIVCAGSNFTASSVVYADAIALPTVFDGVNQLTATVTDPVLFVSGNKAITVQDPAGTSGSQLLTVGAWTLNSVPEISGWWEGDDVNVTGSAISQANDKTGLMRHMVQATGTKQPLRILVDPNFNNQPTMDFDGTDDLLAVTGTNGSLLLPNLSTPGVMVIAVYRFDAITTSGPATTPWTNSTVMGLDASPYFGIAGRTGPLLYAWSNDGAIKTAQNASLLPTTVQLAIYRRSGGTVGVSINGGAEANVACGTPNTSSQHVTFGSSLGAGFFNGQIAIGATFAGQPSAANLARIKNYTRIKYGWTP